MSDPMSILLCEADSLCINKLNRDGHRPLLPHKVEVRLLYGWPSMGEELCPQMHTDTGKPGALQGFKEPRGGWSRGRRAEEDVGKSARQGCRGRTGRGVKGRTGAR